ncbi:PGC-1 and ERR-induced regulator in muscle protein 1, partial [Galemys pyrenaicus]
YSIQLSDQDWAEFSAAAGECDLLQASLASGDEPLSSDIDQGDSSGSSPPRPLPPLKGQPAPRGRGWPSRVAGDKAAPRQPVSRLGPEPALATGTGQQTAGTSPQSEARLPRGPSQSLCLPGPAPPKDNMQRLLQGPAPQGAASGAPGQASRSPPAVGCSPAPQQPPSGPGTPTRSPSRKKRRSTGTKGGGRAGAPTPPGSPRPAEALPARAAGPVAPRGLDSLAGTAGTGHSGLRPESTRTLEGGSGTGPGWGLSTPTPPKTEPRMDLLRTPPRAEPHAVSTPAPEAGPGSSMATADAVLSTPACQPPADSALSTPACQPLPDSALSTPARQPLPDSALSTPARQPSPDSALSTPARQPPADSALSTPACQPPEDTALSTPACQPPADSALSTPACQPPEDSALSTPACQPPADSALSTPACQPPPNSALSTPAYQPLPNSALSTPTCQPPEDSALSTPACQPSPDSALSKPTCQSPADSALSTPACQPRLDGHLLTVVAVPELGLPAPVPEGSPRQQQPSLLPRARADVGVSTPALGRGEQVAAAPVTELGLSPGVSPGVHQERGPSAPGRPSGEPPGGPVRAPKKKKVRFSVAVPGPQGPSAGEASNPVSGPRAAPGSPGAWDAVAVGPRPPQPRILKHLPPPAPSASALGGPGSRACFAVTLPEAYEFFFCDTIEEEDEGMEEADQAEVQWPDVCEYFFQDCRARGPGRRAHAERVRAPPAGDPAPITIPEAYKHFLGEGGPEGGLGPAALLRLQDLGAPRPGPLPEPGPATAEQLDLEVRRAGASASSPRASSPRAGEGMTQACERPAAGAEPRAQAGPLPAGAPPASLGTLSLSQKDMCLVFVAFATWAVRTSDLHAPDAWKTVLLANIGTVSAIRYFRQQVGRGRRSPSP